jgi:hypothetical protein
MKLLVFKELAETRLIRFFPLIKYLFETLNAPSSTTIHDKLNLDDIGLTIRHSFEQNESFAWYIFVSKVTTLLDENAIFFTRAIAG